MPELSPDFQAHPRQVRLVTEAERLSFGYLYNPTFGIEISSIDPLPHQHIAVYEHMLPQDRLRFLLADDAGAGKTIMSGLYLREMLIRRLIRRVLIVPPAGLIGNWRRELLTLFNLDFRIIRGADAIDENPFIGAASDQLIVSVDTLAGDRLFQRLQEADVEPYDLVIFDEAHKLSADKDGDFLISKRKRYHLAESLAGIPDVQPRWLLNWSPRHLLLLTATPHMGRSFPYFCLWRLLDHEAFPSEEAFNDCPWEFRQRYFIRRTKEEMVRYDGARIYPDRQSITFSYDLTQGPISEQALYDETTSYLDTFYNKAALLNDTAAQLALSVFQRRLASSTYALLQSLMRRQERLTNLIADIEAGTLDPRYLEQLRKETARLAMDEKEAVALSLDDNTADEEDETDGIETGERDMRDLENRILTESLADLREERDMVKELVGLAQQVYQAGDGAKFARLIGLLKDPDYAQEKMLIFTEHRDTLDFLVRKLEEHGYTGLVETIHGGMDFTQRETAVARFRLPIGEGGAQYLIATDAAGEGINLQVAWLMTNYDIPWNPARLEQRMGRIHRYGQKKSRVMVFNIIAGGTREGQVMETLLEKLENMRKELRSDKVFDVVGRLLEGVSMRDLMRRAMSESGAEQAVRELGGKLTEKQFKALQEREQRLYATGGDVAVALPRLNSERERDIRRRLLPGYMQRFTEGALDAFDVTLEMRDAGVFTLAPRHADALAPLVDVIERYPSPRNRYFTFLRPDDPDSAIFLHPGESVFERLRALVFARMGEAAQRGAVFLDPQASEPSLYLLCRASVMREADDAIPALRRCAMLETRLMGVRQYASGQCALCPPEQLLLLPDGEKIAPTYAPFAARADKSMTDMLAWLQDGPARNLAEEQRGRLLAALPGRLDRVKRSCEQEYLRWLDARQSKDERAKAGDTKAAIELAEVTKRLRGFTQWRDAILRSVQREPELVVPGDIDVLAVALILPAESEAARRDADARVEAIAMAMARAAEEEEGATVYDVSTPAGARMHGFPDYPGFDLYSVRSDGEERFIEVKGRAGTGEIQISENEWSAAGNHLDRYWLYVVFGCDGQYPSLHRVQCPASVLAVRYQGVRITAESIRQAAQQ